MKYLFLSFLLFSCAQDTFKNLNENTSELNASADSDDMQAQVAIDSSSNTSEDLFYLTKRIFDYNIPTSEIESMFDFDEARKSIEDYKGELKHYQLVGNYLIPDQDVIAKWDIDGHHIEQYAYQKNGLEFTIEGSDYMDISCFIDSNARLRKLFEESGDHDMYVSSLCYFNDQSSFPFYFFRDDYIMNTNRQEEIYFTHVPETDTVRALKVSFKHNNPDEFEGEFNSEDLTEYEVSKDELKRSMDEINANIQRFEKAAYLDAAPFIPSPQLTARFYNKGFKDNVFLVHPKLFSAFMPVWGEGKPATRQKYNTQYADTSRILVKRDWVSSYYESGGWIDYQFLGFVLDPEINHSGQMGVLDFGNNTLGAYLITENTGGSLTKAAVLFVHLWNDYSENKAVPTVELLGIYEPKNLRDNAVSIRGDCLPSSVYGEGVYCIEDAYLMYGEKKIALKTLIK